MFVRITVHCATMVDGLIPCTCTREHARHSGLDGGLVLNIHEAQASSSPLHSRMAVSKLIILTSEAHDADLRIPFTTSCGITTWFEFQ